MADIKMLTMAERQNKEWSSAIQEGIRGCVALLISQTRSFQDRGAGVSQASAFVADVLPNNIAILIT